MNQDDVKKQIEFERQVKVGDICWAYWTSCGIYYEAEVAVEVINKESYRVRITKTHEYPVGSKVNVPMYRNIMRWTWNNRLAGKE